MSVEGTALSCKSSSTLGESHSLSAFMLLAMKRGKMSVFSMVSCALFRSQLDNRSNGYLGSPWRPSMESISAQWKSSSALGRSLRRSGFHDLGHEARENVGALCNELWSALSSNRWKVRLHVLLQSVGRLVKEIVSRQSGGLTFSL
jgi:hypothetical protein